MKIKALFPLLLVLLAVSPTTHVLGQFFPNVQRYTYCSVVGTASNTANMVTETTSDSIAVGFHHYGTTSNLHFMMFDLETILHA